MTDRDHQPPGGDAAPGPGHAAADPGDAAAEGASGRSEPRAVDGVSGRVRQEDLDPVTLAQLAAWFGAPAAFGDTPPHLVERARGRGDEDADEDEDPEMSERRRRVRALLDAADEALLGRIEGWHTAGDAFVGRLPAPPPLSVERPVTRFDLAVWNLRLAGEPREVERPPDIADAMEEVTPQAVLRDLHRPVMRWNLRLDPMDLGMDVGGERTREAIRDVVDARYQVRMDEQPSPRRILAEARRDLRARLAEPWEDAYQVRERSAAEDGGLVPTEDDMYWFNLIPVDD